MSPAELRRCIYPGCERPAVPPHPLGGPQPSFCDLEEHNALTAHLERRRLAVATGEPSRDERAPGGQTPGERAAGDRTETVTEPDRRFSDGR